MASTSVSEPYIDDPVAELEAIEAELRRREVPERLRASIPPVFTPFFKPARYKGAHGGRGSGKSQAMGRLLCLKCLENPGTRFACLREIQLSLQHSVKR